MTTMHYRYEARVNQNSWYIRLFCWAWWQEPRKIDFCRLFWGYLFMPFNLLGRLLAAPFYYTYVGIRKWSKWVVSKMPIPEAGTEEWEAKRQQYRVRLEHKESRKARNRKRANQFFTVVGTVAVKFRFVFYGFLGAAALGLALAVGYGLYWLGVGAVWLAPIIANWFAAQWTNILLFLAMAVGMLALAVIVVLALAKSHDALEDRGMHPGASFAQAMKTGFWGVKSRTCPKIVVIDDE